MNPTDSAPLLARRSGELSVALRQTGIPARISRSSDHTVDLVWPTDHAESRATCGLQLDRHPQTAARQLASQSVTAEIATLDDGCLRLTVHEDHLRALTHAPIKPIANRIAAAHQHHSADRADPWTSAISALHEAMVTVSNPAPTEIEAGRLALEADLSYWADSRISHLRLPEAIGDPAAVQHILAEQGVTAAVRSIDPDDPSTMTLVLDSLDDVHALTSAMLGPVAGHLAAHADLTDAIRNANLPVALFLDRRTGAMTLTATDVDDSLETDLQALATVLGALDLETGWDLYYGVKNDRRKRREHLVDRLAFCLTGLTGAPVHAAYEAGCEHEPASAAFHLSLQQAHQVTDALVAAADEDEAAPTTPAPTSIRSATTQKAST